MCISLLWKNILRNVITDLKSPFKTLQNLVWTCWITFIFQKIFCVPKRLSHHQISPQMFFYYFSYVFRKPSMQSESAWKFLSISTVSAMIRYNLIRNISYAIYVIGMSEFSFLWIPFPRNGNALNNSFLKCFWTW